MTCSLFAGCDVDMLIYLCAWFAVAHIMVMMLILTIEVDNRSGGVVKMMIVQMRANSDRFSVAGEVTFLPYSDVMYQE
jgi:hypothetical protein